MIQVQRVWSQLS